jgi:putative DNA methylase
MATQKKISKPKAEQVLDAVSALLEAGKPQMLEGLDFSDPNRPKSCLEVDFPILPINEVAVIEGNADKPIYQVSKYWARRSSSVFRAMLIAAASKAPTSERQAGATVWKSFYGNHQGNPDFSKLKVADIFMGGGTTLVEAARLGMEVFGNDLNPMSWFVVKSELARTTKEEVESLLADVDEKIGASLRPYFVHSCPKGHKGRWISKDTGANQPEEFDPTAVPYAERGGYKYIGPELIYTFWAKHGPCQADGCGHKTPLMGNPVFAVKTLMVKAWLDKACGSCNETYDLEQRASRMAPSEPYVIASSEKPHAIMDEKGHYACPKCGVESVDQTGRLLGESISLGKAENKRVYLHLMVDPEWLKGAGPTDAQGLALGGSATDSAEENVRWYRERAKTIAFIEIRGEVLPETIVHPATGRQISTMIGTAEMRQTATGMQPRKSSFACKSPTCGRGSDVLDAVRASHKTGPMSPFAYHLHCPECDADGEPYSGRSFVPAKDVSAIVASELEWASRKDADLAGYWPTDELSNGWKTHKWGIPDHGYTHYWKMFNSRQLLVLSQLLKMIVESPVGQWDAKEALLGSFQQYIRNQNLLCFWNESADKMEPHFSGNNYSLKSRPIENNLFGKIGRGNWRACAEGAIEALAWRKRPWERVTKTELQRTAKDLAKELKQAKSLKVPTGDEVLDRITLTCGSSTDLHRIGNESIDMVITDPPFSELVQYSELSDFFYVWLAPTLRNRYPEIFGNPFTPKTLEAVENPYRQGKDAKAFYQRILTECWREAHRIIKPGGLLAFTFHHSEDGPWVQVLESLFSAGFYLEATYPIRGDESKGDSQFGSMKVEYDIIHVCRKRVDEPEMISWAKLRRRISDDIQQLKDLLEQHQHDGLPKADLEVIKRGKALEYFSKHYGKVYVERGREFTLPEALTGIRQLIDDSEGGIVPPVLAEPYTRQFLRIFDQIAVVPRDQMMKFLRGTGTELDVFEKLGWCIEEKKSFHLVAPLEFAQAWRGKPRKGMSGDLDQALFLIGACYPDSGIRVDETLNNPNFIPHPAVADLLDWLGTRGGLAEMRRASHLATKLFSRWLADHKSKEDDGKRQFDMFGEAS